MSFLVWLEGAAFSAWVRESGSFWAYPAMQFFHTLGMTMVVGLSAVVMLRLLGFASRIPAEPLARFYSLIWIGFWISAVSGVVLFMADATTTGRNPLFGAKLLFVAAGMASLVVIRRRVLAPRSAADPRRLAPIVAKALGLLSLLLWLGAIAAGRLTAYLGARTLP